MGKYKDWKNFDRGHIVTTWPEQLQNGRSCRVLPVCSSGKASTIHAGLALGQMTFCAEVYCVPFLHHSVQFSDKMLDMNNAELMHKVHWLCC